MKNKYKKRKQKVEKLLQIIDKDINILDDKATYDVCGDLVPEITMTIHPPEILKLKSNINTLCCWIAQLLIENDKLSSEKGLSK